MPRLKMLLGICLALGFMWAVLKLAAMGSAVDMGHAPDITLATQKGPLSLSSQRGKVVLIDMWATWCGPCRESMPGIQKVYEKYRDKGFEVLGAALEDKESVGKIPGVVKQLGVTYPVGIPVKSDDMTAYDGQSIPRMYLVDRRGRFRWKPVGWNPSYDAELDQRVEDLLKED